MYAYRSFSDDSISWHMNILVCSTSFSRSAAGLRSWIENSGAPSRYSCHVLPHLMECHQQPCRQMYSAFNSDGLFSRLHPLVERSSVLPWFRDLFDLEKTASQIRAYESYLVPGILQTEEYAHATAEAVRPVLSAEEVEQAMALKMTRQDILDRDDAPRMWFTMDESTLRREVGGVYTMKAQCQHLLSLRQNSNVVIQVISNSEGLSCAFGCSFILLSLLNQMDVVYVEGVGSARYIREQEEMSRYSLIFDHLRGSALSDEKSAELIERLANEY
jgi:hypothetical protein